MSVSSLEMNAMARPTDQADGRDVGRDLQWVRWSKGLLNGKVVEVVGDSDNVGGWKLRGLMRIKWC